MVRSLSIDDRKAIAGAIAQAERATCAEIVTVVAAASDAYQSYVLLYGLMVGSAIDTFLWMNGILTDFPLLLAIQLATMTLFAEIPWLRRLCLKFVPMRIRHHRAAHRAFAEYLAVSHHVPATKPIVLLYISLAERYAHVLPSRTVREKIADKEWNGVIEEFTAAVATEGLRSACVKAIEHCTRLLAPHFPENDEAHMQGHHVIEIRK